MSEVIESYIRRHPHVSEKDAFDGFLQEERIKAWVGSDDGRRERLRKEFGRVWGSMHVADQVASPRSGPSGPQQAVAPARVRVEVKPEPVHEPVVVRAAPTPGAPLRKLQVMCTTCSRVDVWMAGEVISCHSCGRVYDDMLQLIRVTPVGPFEFMFGEGWVGYATAGGIALALVGLYGVLRWVR